MEFEIDNIKMYDIHKKENYYSLKQSYKGMDLSIKLKTKEDLYSIPKKEIFVSLIRTFPIKK